MMDEPVKHPVYRIRKLYRRGAQPKGYQHTLELLDDRAGKVMATCDVVGRFAFAKHEIVDHLGRTWRMQPNRKLMPSRWIVTDPEQTIAMQFDQKIAGKLVNPLYKCAMSFLGSDDRELYRLIDPRTNIPDRMFGTGPDDWVIIEGDALVAKLVRLPREETQASGLRGVLRKLVTTSDPGIVSVGAEHLFPANFSTMSMNARTRGSIRRRCGITA
ncbi:MAG TPA: hypothetical protein VKZ91_00690 [Woeseiaceae bacterium]|nr:hypothetical protein [Woeseiaceae bacterium]